MASAGFSLWVAAGRPITPAQPILELVNKCKALWPAHANSFGWYADASHYEDGFPQDHTPYSADAWPVKPNPKWVVFATDLMANAMGGTAATQKVFDHLLASAKNGTAPWIKYLIWNGHLYDVRWKWAQQPADDHYDHIHISARTDHQHTSLGSWSPLGGATESTTVTTESGDDDMTPDQAAQLKHLHDVIVTGYSSGIKTKADPDGKNDHDIRYYLYDQGKALAELKAQLAAQAGQLTAQGSVIQALSQVVQAGGGNVDTAAILAGVAEQLAALKAGLEEATRDAIADAEEGGAAAVRQDSN